MSKEGCSNETTDGLEQTADEFSAFKELQSQGFDVLPLYEKSQYEFVNIQKYSMRTNEKLHSRWREYAKTGKIPTEKHEYKVGNYHFHNCINKYLPSESPSNYPSARFQLRPGPGADKYGPIPIPADMMLRKFKITAHSYAKNKTKTLRR